MNEETSLPPAENQYMQEAPGEDSFLQKTAKALDRKQWIAVIALIGFLLFLLISKKIDFKWFLFGLGVVGFVIYLFTLKEETHRLILEHEARKITWDALQAKRKSGEISEDASVYQLLPSKLFHADGKPIKWSIPFEILEPESYPKTYTCEVDVNWPGMILGFKQWPEGINGRELRDLVHIEGDLAKYHKRYGDIFK